MNDLYRDNSREALDFYSRALSSGGCMNCGHCPIKQELMRMQGDGMIRERHAPLRRARHQRLMRGGVSTALVPYNPGIGTVSNYVNNVAAVADNAPLVTGAMVASILALKGLYDSYKEVQNNRALAIEQKEEVKADIAEEIKKEGEKVIDQVAKQEVAIVARKPRGPRKRVTVRRPRAPARRPRAAPKRKATKKKCKLISYTRCY
jgi:hypothetical protein